MEITKDTNIICIDGDFKVLMGKGMTTFYFKEREKFVFYTKEIDKLIQMLQASKVKLNEN